MWPAIPADLSALSADELLALEEQLVAAFRENSPTVASTEDVANLSTLTDGIRTVRAEMGSRAEAAEALAAQVAEMATEILGQAADEDEDDGEGDTPAEPAPTGDPAPTPANPTPDPNPETGEAPAPTARAASARSSRATLAAMAARQPARTQPRSDLAPAGAVTITASAGVEGYEAGQQLRTMRDLAEALMNRHHGLGRVGPGGPEDRVPVARFTRSLPADRQLSSRDSQEANQAKIDRFSAEPSLVAAGGLCAPVAGYYEQLVVSEAHRPVADALASFGADRGGIRFNPPPTMGLITSGVAAVTSTQDVARSVTDGATNSNTTVTSATAAFVAGDVGRPISGAGIPTGTTISAVGSATSITISQAATATATGVTLSIGSMLKGCFTVTCPTIGEVVTQAIYSCLQFGNFGARTFPEQVQAWTQLAAALWARTADTMLLDGIAAGSTAVTSAGLVGGAREVIARFAQAAAGMRSRNRMPVRAPMTLLLPQWVGDMAGSDSARTFAAPLSEVMTVDSNDVDGWLADRAITVAWYADSKTGGAQVFGAQSTGVLNQYPAIAYGYLFPEGTWLHLDGGTLDLGLIRDSGLIAGNNFRMFSESWENVAKVGPESLEVALTSYPDGSYGAAKTVTVPIVT